ncbi:MAG TPA: 8-amino-7-oxononanoate synthase [Desulfobulbaceae bacterium]|nr:8-amino-7-oxononanoate synthase [Desulfobulbaceae bacterium]
MTDFYHHLAGQLAQLDQEGLCRRLIPMIREDQGRIAAGGRLCLNLSGNDYLGLGGNRELIAELYRQLSDRTLLEHFGPGATASRLMTGNGELYARLEGKLAELYGSESCLVFNSGYHGNTGILPCLTGKGDLIVADRLCHASLIDGMRLSRADTVRYHHLDYDHLTEILRQKRHRFRHVFIVSESVFSMDGDTADLHRLIALKKEFQAIIYLDEAHAVGVFGPQGLGLAEQEGVLPDIDLLFGTFGKAMAGLGGFIACRRVVADSLVNRARSFIFTTGLPPVCLSWLLLVLDRIPAMRSERRRLQKLATELRRELTRLGLTTDGNSQIVPVVIGESMGAVRVAKRLQEQGYWVTAIRPPTVPAGTARLRLSLTATMDQAELAPLPGLIAEAMRA